MKVESARVSLNYGNYDLLSNKKSWNLGVVITVDGNTIHYSELFDIKPDIDNALPSDIIQEVAERKGRHLYSSSAKEDAKTLLMLRSIEDQADSVFLHKKIADLEKRIKILGKQLEVIHEASGEV